MDKKFGYKVYTLLTIEEIEQHIERKKKKGIKTHSIIVATDDSFNWVLQNYTKWQSDLNNTLLKCVVFSKDRSQYIEAFNKSEVVDMVFAFENDP